MVHFIGSHENEARDVVKSIRGLFIDYRLYCAPLLNVRFY